ncbi:protein tilB homolog [Trichonephila inaurata madagascariensis]|uniref:Protein tilB homolog n=1 Tax=Trichonephila inaurata madagascariensis TaxID=2747483 RepID=A0A8X6MB76_9ARAC|nr:protein tilB homolog [Trichonephila inaurata madagascariensis]
MATITEDLLRKCAEHNECEIFSLEEVSLHQRNIKNYLTGNPCTEFEGYRDFVIATLPQLMILDGDKIKKSERIMALQKYYRTRKEILEQEKRYLKNVQFNNEDIIKSFEDNTRDNANYDEDSREKFWKQPTKHTPLSRIEIYKHMEKSQKKNDSEIKKPKTERKLITDDGKILNVNEAKLDFEFIDDEENNCFKLNLAVYRFLDTSLVEADVQPNYVRVKVNGKYFQLLLPDEVHPDLSTSLRSQTTGHLLITMPKANGIIKKRKFMKGNSNHRGAKEKNKSSVENDSNIQNKALEDGQSVMQLLDKIVSYDTDRDNEVSMAHKEIQDAFVDNPEVPPLI